tara:strand:- start:202 stop:354 length:153 start_codon:yes stop_codon:yes gene_type:complete
MTNKLPITQEEFDQKVSAYARDLFLYQNELSMEELTSRIETQLKEKYEIK